VESFPGENVTHAAIATPPDTLGPLPEPVPAASIPAPAIPAPDIPAPEYHLRPWVQARAIGGMAALGLAAGLAGQEAALASAPAGLAVGCGVFMLATPALVVGHQALRLQASPGALLSAVADAFTRGGVVALGAAPAVLWLAATSDMGPTIGLLGLLGIGAFALVRVLTNLVDVERRAGGSLEAATCFSLLWTGLAALIGLRLLFAFLF
jgi:hypothetical protein